MSFVYRSALTITFIFTLGALSGCKDGQAPPPAPAPAAAAVAAAVAHTHAAEGATCPVCDPAKRDAKRMWCAEHARYEDRCWLCHPELRDAKREYCDVHAVYIDECEHGASL